MQKSNPINIITSEILSRHLLIPKDDYKFWRIPPTALSCVKLHLIFNPGNVHVPLLISEVCLPTRLLFSQPFAILKTGGFSPGSWVFFPHFPNLFYLLIKKVRTSRANPTGSLWWCIGIREELSSPIKCRGDGRIANNITTTHAYLILTLYVLFPWSFSAAFTGARQSGQGALCMLYIIKIKFMPVWFVLNVSSFSSLKRWRRVVWSAFV